MARAGQAREVGTSTNRTQALEAIYESHAQALHRRCLRLTGDPSAADDLMQEVFVRFIARFPEPPAGMNVRGYLYATAQNTLWKQLRDGHETADGDIEATLGPDDDLERDPERSTMLVEQRTLVRRCAALLTGRQRRALTLRDVEGHSYAEIGSELGIGDDAVAQVISRARVRLRHALRRAQIDLDQIPAECRALLGPLSDYVDGRASSNAPEIERHLASCEVCRTTVGAYQEAGSRLRGAAPLAGMLARVGELVRGSGERPLGIGVGMGAAASVAAAVAIGGGGIVVAQKLTASQRATPAVSVESRSHAAIKHLTATAPSATATSPPPARLAPVGANPPLHAHGRGTHARAPRAHPRPAIPKAATPTSVPPPTPTKTSSATSPRDTTPAPTPERPKVPATTPTVPVGGASVSPGDVVSTATTTLDRIRDGLTTPAVSVPNVTTPAVSTPPVTVPAITVPPVSTPAATTPIGNVPGITAPAVSTPAVTVPAVTVPAITTPILKIPPITTPRLP